MSRLGVLVVAILSLAGCASPPPSPSPSPPPPSAPSGLPADHVLLAIDDASGWPGFEGVEDGRVVTLSADGTLVARAPAAVSMLPIAVTRLNDPELDEVWADVTASGVVMDGSFDLPGLFDASTTTFRVDDGARATSLSIYGLGAGPADVPFDVGEARLRTAASSLVASLQARGRGEAWTPPALLLWSTESHDAPAGKQPKTVPWTVDVELATAGVSIDTPVFDRCVRLEGDLAADAAAFVRPLVADVGVEQDGIRYALGVRPIYPDELGKVDCP